MKCRLFNRRFDNYDHIITGSEKGDRLHTFGAEKRGWVANETMKDDTFLRSAIRERLNIHRHTNP